MQRLNLYDPNCKPADWTRLAHPGQFAVFLTDVATDIERSPEENYFQPGEDSICLIFDSLEEAENYCEATVARVPHLRCDIYDHTGKSKPPSLTCVNKTHMNAESKKATWGWAMAAVRLPVFWITWLYHRTQVVPLIVGFNLLLGGLRLVDWGKGGIETRRAQREY